MRIKVAASTYSPQFAVVAGMVQVIDADTLLAPRVASEQPEYEENDPMMNLYLDFLMKQALTHPLEVEAYTEAMAIEDDELISEVEVDGH